MEMTMRWFGKDYDTVTLEQIKQTRYATGIITTLYNKMPGEVWNLDEILAMKKEVEDAGLHLAGIESVNVSDAIKTGGEGRDHDIQAYIETLENLGKADIHMVCYNFMPVFDWTRTELDRVREDGSTVMAYNQDAIDKMDPEKMFDAIKDDMNGTVMPGWEPERMAKIKDCNGVQREHNKKLNNGLPILHKVPPKRDYGRYFCIMAEKGGTSHGGLTEKSSPFFHAQKQEVNAYGR